MGEDIEFNYLSFGFADNTGKNQNQVKIRCVVDVVLDNDAQWRNFIQKLNFLTFIDLSVNSLARISQRS